MIPDEIKELVKQEVALEMNRVRRELLSDVTGCVIALGDRYSPDIPPPLFQLEVRLLHELSLLERCSVNDMRNKVREAWKDSAPFGDAPAPKKENADGPT